MKAPPELGTLGELEQLVQPARSTFTLAGSRMAALTSARELSNEAPERRQVLVEPAVRRVRAVMVSLFLVTVVLASQAAVRPI